MNTYQLFTRSGACYFVNSHCVDRAIEKIEKLTGEFVSSWYIAQSVPANSNLITK